MLTIQPDTDWGGDTISGDIRLDGAISDSWLKSTSGDIDARLPRMDSLKLLGKTVSGDVRQMVGNQPGSACRVELGSVSGDLMVR